MLKLASACAFLALFGVAATQSSPQDDFVLSGETAYGMVGAEPICGSFASSLKWSDDGSYLLLQRMDIDWKAALGQLPFMPSSIPPAEQSVQIYSVANKKATTFWRSKSSDAMLADLKWFKGSDVAVAVVLERLRTTDPSHPNPMREQVVLFDARSGSTKVIYSVDQQDGMPEIQFELSPSKSFGLLITQWQIQSGAPSTPPDWHFEYRTIDANGGVSAPATVQEGAFVRGWSDDGAMPILALFQRGTDGKLTQKLQALNLASGQMTTVTKPNMYKESEPKLALTARLSGGTAAMEKARKDLRSAWLAGSATDSQALVASDVSEVLLSPTLNAVAYVSQGAALVRPIVQIPKELYLKSKQAAEKMRAMSNAKQLGLALMMYGTDMDDTLPSSRSDIANLLEPYTKNKSLFDGFVYTYRGGLMSDIKEPANTELGYVSGPGGKAIIYADGHVKWRADQ